MAIWQFDLYLLPLAQVQQRVGTIPAQLTEVIWEQGDWWQGMPLLPTYAQRLDQFLPRCERWHENPYCWGWEQGDLLEINVTAQEITSITLRLDTRSVDSIFLHLLLTFAQDFELLFLAQDTLQIIPADLDLLTQVLCASPQHSQAQRQKWWRNFAGRHALSLDNILAGFFALLRPPYNRQRKDH